MFLKLLLKDVNENRLVNMNHVISISPTKNGSSLLLTGDRYCEVAETLEEIEILLTV